MIEPKSVTRTLLALPFLMLSVFFDVLSWPLVLAANKLHNLSHKIRGCPCPSEKPAKYQFPQN